MLEELLQKSNYQVCSVRHENSLFVYCSTDNCYLCEDCYEKSHRGHKVEYLKFLARDHLAFAQSLGNNIMNTLSDCTTSMQIYNKQHYSDAISSKIHAYYEEIISALKESCKAKLHSLQYNLSDNFSNLDKASQTMSTYKDQLRILLGEIQQQTKIYESTILSKKYKWLHDCSVKLSEFNEEALILKENVINSIEMLKQNCPSFNCQYSSADICTQIEQGIELNYSTVADLNASGMQFVKQETQQKKGILRNSNRPSIIKRNRSKQKDALSKTLTPNKMLGFTLKNLAKQNTPSKKESTVAKILSSCCKKQLKKETSEKTPRPILNVDLTKNKPDAGEEPKILTKEISNLKRIYYIDQISKTLSLFVIPRKEFYTVNLKCENSIPDGFATADLNGIVYITGGERNNIILNETYIIDEESYTIIPKASMLMQRRNHGMAAISGVIYAIGGCNSSEKVMKRCEKYTSEKEEWSEIGALSQERNFLSCCCFEERYIYVFGGSSAESNDIYEVYDTAQQLSWESHNFIKDASYKSLIAYCTGSMQISKTEIIIFGGLNEDQYFNYSAILNITDGNIAETSDNLCRNDAFYQRNPVEHEGTILSFGFWSNFIHVFDTKSHKWSAIQLGEEK